MAEYSGDTDRAVSPPSIEWVTVFTAEYTYLSSAIRDHVTRQSQIMQNGLTAIMAAFAVAVSSWNIDNHLLPAIVLALIIPSLCFCLIFLWQAEVFGGERLGIYLATREKEVGRLFGVKPMNWESWIRERKSKTFQYEAAFGIVTCMWLFATILGFVFFLKNFGVQIAGVQFFSEFITCAALTWLLWRRLQPFWGRRRETGTDE